MEVHPQTTGAPLLVPLQEFDLERKLKKTLACRHPRKAH